jgi:peptidoglycan/LPS O-acetylase OafA/YrhL
LSRRGDTQNAFDFIRITAAMAVLYSHSYPLYGLSEPLVPSLHETWGSLAVAVFFVVSGFLVCQSWERDPHLVRFAARRALRIIPGLVAAVFFTTFVAGAISTKLPIVQYVSSRETWAFFFNNASLIAGIDVLPGAFEGTPYYGANGSLWTLRYEVLMYLALSLMGLTGRLRVCCVAAFAVCSVSWIAMSLHGTHRVPLPLPMLWRLHLEFDAYRIARLGAFFFAATCFCVFRDRLPMSRTIAVLLVGLLVVVPGEWTAPMLLLALPYATLVVAHKAPRALQNMRGWDPSYGIYIYAFPVQQVISGFCLAHDLGWAYALWISVVVTLALAVTSWVLIEKPALAFKRSARYAKTISVRYFARASSAEAGTALRSDQRF